MYNVLLQRQIRKYLGGAGEIPEKFQALLDVISQSYDHYESDRKLIERSMDLSSQELIEVNRTIQAQANSQRIALMKLRGLVHSLQLDEANGVAPAPNGDNDEVNIVSVADILQKQIERRSEAEQKLHESEERFRLLAENSTDLIGRYSPDGICLYISPSCRVLAGYEPEEMTGQPFSFGFHPEDIDRASAFDEVLHTGADILTVVYRFRRHDGSIVWFETAVHAIRDAATGEVIEVHGASRDITERKQTALELQYRSSRLSTLMENLQSGVLVEDEDGKINVINDNFCEMFALDRTPHELMGKLSTGMANQAKHLFAEPEQFIERVEDVMRRRESTIGDVLRLRDGRTYERDYIPVVVDDIYRGHLWQCRDVTEARAVSEAIEQLNSELREANQQLTIERDRDKEIMARLEEINQMKSEFVSSVSHELRTPLASIIGFAQTILMDPDLPADMRGEFLQIILEEGRRLAKLINDVLDLARIESGRVILEKIEIDVVPLINRAAQSVALQAEAKHLNFTVVSSESSIIAIVDADRILQVMINLLGNAVKFTQPEGSVTLQAAVHGQDVVIDVIDTGLGIPADDIPRLFEKFFRVHRPGLDIRGTGLGLAIAKHSIELHGGSLTVQSEENKGSTFTIRFPLS